MISNTESIQRQGINLDPRTKLFIAPVVGCVALAVQNQFALFLLVVVLLSLMLFSGLYTKALKYAFTYTITVVVYYLVNSIDNVTVILIGNIILFVLQRMMIIGMAGGFVGSTITIPELVAALEQLKIPRIFIIPLSVSLRFFPTIRVEYSCLKDSMKTRNIDVSPKGFLCHPISYVEHTLIPLLMRGLKISDELAASAMIRGLDSDKKKTSIYQFRMQVIDYLVLFLFVCFIAALIYFY